MDFSISNIQIEQAVLAELLYDNSKLEKINDFLLCEHFFHDTHRTVFKAIETYVSLGRLADPITLKYYFQEFDNSSEMNEYILNLAAMRSVLRSIESYARIVYDLFLKRQILKFGKEIVEISKDSLTDTSTDEQLEEISRKLMLLSESRLLKDTTVSLSVACSNEIRSMSSVLRGERKLMGVTTGLTEIDTKLNGLHNSDLIILAGRPAMGKTALATNIAFNSAKRKMLGHVEGEGVLFFSMEMSANQLANRIISCESNINSDILRSGSYTASDIEKFIELQKSFEELPFFIDDTPALSIEQIRQRVKNVVKKHDIGLVIVDYLQLITMGKTRSENRTNDISEISRSLKSIAKEFNLPVVALSQLSRAVESRDDKRPLLSDLRDSGAIEQDADLVLFVYREEYYLLHSQPDPSDQRAYSKWYDKIGKAAGAADLIVGKNRHGATDVIRLAFDANKTKFYDLKKNN